MTGCSFLLQSRSFCRFLVSREVANAREEVYRILRIGEKTRKRGDERIGERER